jgi:hypothetical protein
MRPLVLTLFLAAPAAHAQSEIHVDHHCRIYARDRTSPTQPYGHPTLHRDTTVCRLESVFHTRHYDEVVDQGTVKRTRVEIREQMYVLHNITPTPAVFIVDHPLPRGWQIDSTPAPTLVADDLATFRVVAQPGETIRLHVGERH